MLIRLLIEKTQPLAGTAAVEGSDPVPFDGWLELLSVVSELVAAADGWGGGRWQVADGPERGEAP